MKLQPLLPLSLVLAACHLGPEFWVEETETFDLPAQGLQSLEVITHSGNVEIRGVDGLDKVEVVAKKSAGGLDQADAEEAMAALEVTREISEGELVIGYRWREEMRSGWGQEIAFDIRCPKALLTTVSTHNGNVGVEGMGAAASVTTHNGDIQVFTGGSELQLVSHNGRIRAQSTAAGAVRVSASTHNGGISVDLSPAASAVLDCSWHNGGVELDLEGLAAVEQGDDHFRGRLGQGEGSVELSTHNGRIRIH